MIFQLNVYGSPWQSNCTENIESFVLAALKDGHDIKRIFFFFDGVYHALNSQSPASDEYDIPEVWKNLALKKIELLVCIAAAANRGVLSNEEASRYDKPVETADNVFEITGLGQWASGFHDVDRIISFK